tara:strand:+ start:4121 stop:4708 length:588 start_codon:yes stop_codon:yes gene_type:complete
MRYHAHRGARHFVLSVGYMGTQISDFFGDGFEDVPISYAMEDTPLGTGGAVINAVAHLKSPDPCLLMNGDTFFPVDSAQLQQLHLRTAADLSVALFNATEDDRFGAVDYGDDGRVTSFDSGKANVGQAANGGVYMLSPAILPGLNEADMPLSFEETVIPGLIASGHRVYATTQKASFIDIGLPADYELAQKFDFH